MALPAGDALFRQHMMRRLRFLEGAQWWPRELILERQRALLRELIRIAYREVPFYRELLDGAGVIPDSIRATTDLRALPVVTKDMLRAGYPKRVSRSTGQRTYEVASSGSTGMNFRVLEDSETAGWYRATFLLACEWTGWRIGDRHVQSGMTLHRSIDKRLKDGLLRCHYVSAYDLTDEHLDETLMAMERHRIEHIRGYPGSIYMLARRAEERGWRRPLQSIATWGDTLYAHYRRTIEDAFQTRVFDQYGIGEGMHVAAQCGTDLTYHVHDLDVIVEVLNDDGAPVAAGQPGHVILTRLHPGPMPLIRYRVGDVAVLGDRTCACGRGFSILESIQGRDTDIVLTPSGNRLIVHFFTGILEHFATIREFQVVQSTGSAITLRVVPTDSWDDQESMRVIDALRTRGAEDLDISIELVETIPLPASGKRRFIISEYSRTVPRL